jgi:hypothetical protein
MGYTTDFLGHIDITPSLNEHEAAYLSAFRHSRHWDRPGGPYDVAANPFAEDGRGVDRDAYNSLGQGKPQLYCQWEVCWDGCCLTFDGGEKFYQPIRWLRYLIDHFLVPDAQAASSGLSVFDDFSFDHRLDGLIVGNRRDTREMFAICVDDSNVHQKTLVPGLDSYRGLPRLPYERAIDEWADDLAEIRRSGRGPRAAG